MHTYSGNFDDANCFIFMDENGDADLKYVAKCYATKTTPDQNSKSFCLTAASMHRSDVIALSTEMNVLKFGHWQDGKYAYDGINKITVCLHSREIRRKTGPFSIDQINHLAFQQDLSSVICNANFSITSAYIDKEKLYQQYTTHSRSPYDLAVTFVLERIVKYQLQYTEAAILILESRGKREDSSLMKTIMNLINYGTLFVPASEFHKIIGVYFNPKRDPNDCCRTYAGLELADLVSYPIYNFCKNNRPGKDYAIVCTKIAPYGLKRFPQ